MRLPSPFRSALAAGCLLATSLTPQALAQQQDPMDTVYTVYDAKGQPALAVLFRDTYKGLWNDAGSGANMDGQVYCVDPAKIPAGFLQLGHLFWDPNRGGPNGKVESILVKDISPDKSAIRTPTGVSNLWDDHGSGGDHNIEVFTFRAPQHYRGIGTVVRGDGGGGLGVGGLPAGELNEKTLTSYACLRKDLVDIGKIEKLVWNDSGSGANKDFSAWTISWVQDENDKVEFGSDVLHSMRWSCGSFVGNGTHDKPEDSRALVLRFYYWGREANAWMNKIRQQK